MRKVCNNAGHIMCPALSLTDRTCAEGYRSRSYFPATRQLIRKRDSSVGSSEVYESSRPPERREPGIQAATSQALVVRKHTVQVDGEVARTSCWRVP